MALLPGSALAGSADIVRKLLAVAARRPIKAQIGHPHPPVYFARLPNPFLTSPIIATRTPQP